MKKKFYSLLTAYALLLCGAALYSCEDKNSGDGGTIDPPKDTLSVDPSTGMTFEYADTETVLVEIEKTADTYDATCPDEWVRIVKSTDSFTVGVDEYTYDDAEAAGFEPRTATITVSSGTADDVTISVTQNSPEQVFPSLSTDPEELVFSAGGELTQIVEIVASNIDSEIVETVPAEFDWIVDAAITGNMLSVTVSNYIGTEVRTGHITLSADELEEPYTLDITQHPVAPLNLTGQWNWTGKKHLQQAYTDVSGTLTAVYDEDNGYYKFTTLPEVNYSTQAGYAIGDGGIALCVDENNKVLFKQFDRLYMYGLWDMFFSVISASYHNMVRYINLETLSESTTPIIANDTAIEITVSADGNTITFPLTGTADDSTEYGYAFGFGSVQCDQTTKEEIPNDPFMWNGLYNSLVLTRVQ